MKKPNHYKLDLQLFAEEKQTEEVVQPTAPQENYLEVIKNLKESSVSKEEYQKVVDENKRLLNDYINGSSQTQETTPTEGEMSIDELRAYLGGNKAKTDLDYWEKALKLRDKVMARGEIDPMVPNGTGEFAATQADFLQSARVCSVMQECVDASGGDPDEFHRLLDKKIIGGLPKPKK